MRMRGLVLLLASLGCRSTDAPPPVSPPTPDAPAVAAPLPATVDPLACAKATPLPPRAPEDLPGLPHAFRLSANVISGAEPHGEEGLDTLARLGVRTILSVDGKAPDADGAARRGMRYVHIPIQYSGVRPDEVLRIAKTFRELPAPFYIHCFHGKHRGPPAAEIGRLVLDGASRERALAEMAQWCGTADKYRGLYRDVATAPIPSEAATRAYVFDFPSAHAFRGLRSIMVPIPRAFDNLEALATRDFAPDPEHPDLVAVEEATQLAGLFAQAVALDDVKARPADLRGWMAESAGTSAELRDALRTLPDGGADARTRAREALGALKNRCTACHKAYRD